jgi:IS30 family transposase
MVVVLPIALMRRMSRPGLLALHPRLREVVASKLVLDWSPEQISGWLKTQYPDDESMRVSHETIYIRKTAAASRRVSSFSPIGAGSIFNRFLAVIRFQFSRTSFSPT